MLNPWDALPLPPRPSLERYRKLAKQLLKAYRADAVGEWAVRWIERPASRPIEGFAREKLTESGPKLTVAQFVIARSHGFESWAKFQKHLDALARKGSPVARFEAAADAIVKLRDRARWDKRDPPNCALRSSRSAKSLARHQGLPSGCTSPGRARSIRSGDRESGSTSRVLARYLARRRSIHCCRNSHSARRT